MNVINTSKINIHRAQLNTALAKCAVHINITYFKNASAWTSLFLLVFIYELFLYSHGDFIMFHEEFLDQTFNSLLIHIIHGDTFIDKDAIGFESFSYQGHTIAYFSIFPALLRLPFLISGFDLNQLHAARLSCVLASTITTLLTCRIFQMLHYKIKINEQNTWLFAIVLIGVIFSGPNVFLSESAYIYKEPVLWGSVFSTTFNIIVIMCGTTNKLPNDSRLCWLSALAGLAMNTRPSVGFDLVVGFGLIWLMCVRAEFLKGGFRETFPQLLLSGTILGIGLGIAGAVNFVRWGNPLTFVNFEYSDLYVSNPARMEIYRNFGTFNVFRIPFSALQYMTSIPYFAIKSVHFYNLIGKTYDNMEGPPSSPFLTQPILIYLAAVGFKEMLRNLVSAAAYIGHILCGLLLCAALYTALRYEADLAGLYILPAAFGYPLVAHNLSQMPLKKKRATQLILSLFLVIGIISSHYVYLMSSIYSLGTSGEVKCSLQIYAPFIKPVDHYKCPEN